MRCKRRYMHGKKLRRSPIKNDKYEIQPIDSSSKVIAGSAPTTGGLGLIIDSAKKVFQGYSKTNPEIIQSARQMPGKI